MPEAARSTTGIMCTYLLWLTIQFVLVAGYVLFSVQVMLGRVGVPPFIQLGHGYAVDINTMYHMHCHTNPSVQCIQAAGQ
jgi:hypothetical protein